MKKAEEKMRFIRVRGMQVEVSEEVRRVYYKAKRQMKYMESDIKVGRTKIDSESGELIFIPSKEDSLDRLKDQGIVFPSEEVVEDMGIKNLDLKILKKAMKELSVEEKELLNARYFEGLTAREIGKIKGVSHVAILKREKKILKKLKKYFQ